MIVNAAYGEPCALKVAIARGQMNAFKARWEQAGVVIKRIS